MPSKRAASPRRTSSFAGKAAPALVGPAGRVEHAILGEMRHGRVQVVLVEPSSTCRSVSTLPSLAIKPPLSCTAAGTPMHIGGASRINPDRGGQGAWPGPAGQGHGHRGRPADQPSGRPHRDAAARRARGSPSAAAARCRASCRVAGVQDCCHRVLQGADEVLLAHHHSAVTGAQNVDRAAWSCPVRRGTLRTCSRSSSQPRGPVRPEVSRAHRRRLPSRPISVTTTFTPPVCPHPGKKARCWTAGPVAVSGRFTDACPAGAAGHTPLAGTPVPGRRPCSVPRSPGPGGAPERPGTSTAPTTPSTRPGPRTRSCKATADRAMVRRSARR
jgi:hypothetical protein